MTDEEEEKIRKYLDNKGRAIFLMDIVEADMPNFDALFKSYGIALNKALTIGRQESLLPNPTWLVPEMISHMIISPMKVNKMQVLTLGAQGIDILDMKKRSIEIEPLLVTSDSAWGRTDYTSTAPEKEEGDIDGPSISLWL